MREISAPISDDDPDRHLSCQEALQLAFEDILTAAAAAGWSEREIVAALIDLADNHMIGLREMQETSAIIALIKRLT